MPKKKILLYVLLFVVFLVATIPARIIELLIPPNSQVQVSGASGTIWSGKVATATRMGKGFEGLSWSINPLRLLLGEVGGRVESNNRSLNFDANWSIDIGRNLKVSNGTLSSPISQIQSWLPFSGVALAGDINASIESLEFNPQAGPSNVEAQVNWTNASASIAGPMLELGNFAIEAKSLNVGEVSLELLPSENILDAQGGVIVSWPDKINIDVSVTEQVPEELQSTIAFLRKAPNNRRQLTTELKVSL